MQVTKKMVSGGIHKSDFRVNIGLCIAQDQLNVTSLATQFLKFFFTSYHFCKVAENL